MVPVHAPRYHADVRRPPGRPRRRRFGPLGSELSAVGRLPRLQQKKLDSVILLEQVPDERTKDPGAMIRFLRYWLVTGTCDHVKCLISDVYARDRNDPVISASGTPASATPAVIWKNGRLY